MTGTRRPLRSISWWWVVFGVAAVGAAIWISTWWLLAQTHGLHGADKATARMDAIKTSLSVGAGTGGAVALLLAMRRQWLSERDQVHREEVDQHNEAHAARVASATEHDASERRVTDLYVKAVDQLGSDQSVVRLGGLYALERLGQNNPNHQQTIVNVLCAYLRMPYVPPVEEPASANIEQRSCWEERQVRRTAQNILGRHLRDEDYTGQRADGEVPATYWPDISLDLSGAHLDDFVLVDCRLDSVDGSNTCFAGETMMRGLHCSLAFFQGAAFEGHTDFRGITADHAWFSNATFATEVWFNTDEFYPHTKFGSHADFRNATFTVGARFSGATFAGSVDFTGAECGRGAHSVDLDGVCVEDPDAVSPEITNAPSAWPSGWAVDPRRDSTEAPSCKGGRPPVVDADTLPSRCPAALWSRPTDCWPRTSFTSARLRSPGCTCSL